MPFQPNDNKNKVSQEDKPQDLLRRPLQDRTGELNASLEKLRRNPDILLRLFNWMGNGILNKFTSGPIDVLKFSKDPEIILESRAAIYEALGLSSLESDPRVLSGLRYPAHPIGPESDPDYFPQWGICEDRLVMDRLNREVRVEAGNHNVLVSLIFVPEGEKDKNERRWSLDRGTITTRQAHHPFKADKLAEPPVGAALFGALRDIIAAINVDDVTGANAIFDGKVGPILQSLKQDLEEAPEKPQINEKPAP